MPLIDVPHIQQLGPYDCGRACALMVLRHYSVPEADALTMVGRLRIDRQDGCNPGELATWFRGEGWHVNEGWMSVADLRHHGHEGRPVIVLATLHGDGHWLVSRGVTRQTIYAQDPYTGREKYSVADFESVWHDRGRYGEKYDQWGIVAVPKGAS